MDQDARKRYLYGIAFLIETYVFYSWFEFNFTEGNYNDHFVSECAFYNGYGTHTMILAIKEQFFYSLICYKNLNYGKKKKQAPQRCIRAAQKPRLSQGN